MTKQLYDRTILTLLPTPTSSVSLDNHRISLNCLILVLSGKPGKCPEISVRQIEWENI